MYEYLLVKTDEEALGAICWRKVSLTELEPGKLVLFVSHFLTSFF